MTNAEVKDRVQPVLLASQIIIGSLLVGPIPILVIGIFIGPLLAPSKPAAAQAGAPAAPASGEALNMILEYAAIGAGAIAVLMSFILPRVISASGRKSVAEHTKAAQLGGSAGKAAELETIDEQHARLLPQFQSQLIVRAAILEGATFFAAVVYLLTGNAIVTGVAILLLVVILAAFPTRPRVDHWLERQQEKLRDDEFA